MNILAKNMRYMFQWIIERKKNYAYFLTYLIAQCCIITVIEVHSSFKIIIVQTNTEMSCPTMIKW